VTGSPFPLETIHSNVPLPFTSVAIGLCSIDGAYMTQELTETGGQGGYH
jgi:hypothetical protein